jgi:hypothetical protein
VLQRLVDRASGSDAVTVFINTFTSGEAVPEHTHEVEEVLLVNHRRMHRHRRWPAAGRQDRRRGDHPTGVGHAVSHNSGELCEVIAVLASPDVQIGAIK